MSPLINYITIGEIADVNGGKRLRKGKRVQEGVTEHPYIRVVDFREDGFDPTNVKYITQDAYHDVNRYTITHDDVYVSIAGTIGRVGIIPPNFSGANLTENAAKITNIRNNFEKRFLMYYLRSDYGQAEISSKIVGTSQPKLALFRIKEIKVPLYSTPTQRKIASILSAYDDLIENNLRRIKILKEMAQALYREWFVKFRFPGHEKVQMVDSPRGKIPEGWEVRNLGDVIELAYGKGLKKTDRAEGNVPVYGSSGIVGYHDMRLVKGPGIIVGRKGNVGSVHWSDNDFFPIDTVFYVKTKLSLYYVFYNLQTQNFINTDAAVPGLGRNQAYLLSFLVPPYSILKQFEEMIKPFFALVMKMKDKIEVLKHTRDLLLPKLISGKLDVSELEIETEGIVNG